MSRPGMVYLVGGGPGDPGLITLRGVQCLSRADVVLYDALIHRDLLAHCKPNAQLEFVGKRAGNAPARQQAINEKLIAAARDGLCVVRLKGGDPYLFGRGSEEAEVLAAAGIAFEVVPGVPSPLAATAYAGISLSHRDKASSIAYLTATESPDKQTSSHDFSKLATATQTLVIFMGVRKLAELTAQLIAHGRSPDCPAAVISKASLPEQQTIVGTVADIAQKAQHAGVSMPALTVIGEVVALRQQLRWYDNKPLFGKRVLVTRAQEQAGDFIAALREAGAAAIEQPTIFIEPPTDMAPLQKAVEEVGEYDWVLFTSVNGVRRFMAELSSQHGDVRRFGAARVGAIGPSTRDCLATYGIAADAMPDTYRGEALAEAVLANHDNHMHGLSVLLPRAEVARDALPDMLRQAGARVDVVSAYRSLPLAEDQAAQLRKALASGDVDIATFTSTSTVTNTVNALGSDAAALLSKVVVASIGPITTESAQKLGIRVDVTAKDYTIAGLICALEDHFQ